VPVHRCDVPQQRRAPSRIESSCARKTRRSPQPRSGTPTNQPRSTWNTRGASRRGPRVRRGSDGGDEPQLSPGTWDHPQPCLDDAARAPDGQVHDRTVRRSVPACTRSTRPSRSGPREALGPRERPCPPATGTGSDPPRGKRGPRTAPVTGHRRAVRPSAYPRRDEADPPRKYPCLPWGPSSGPDADRTRTGRGPEASTVLAFLYTTSLLARAYSDARAEARARGEDGTAPLSRPRSRPGATARGPGSGC
jgi:hypothetical protein